MPDIAVSSQVFDIAFHPTRSLLFAGLLDGHIEAFTYADGSQRDAPFHAPAFTLRPSKKSCRALETSADGALLWAGGKGRALYTVDVATHKVIESRKGIHEAPINRIKRLLPYMLATGDDDGVVKLWDPRKPGPSPIRAYAQHFDFISDFLWLEDKKHLIASSGDGTLSVMDVRASKPEPHAQSEDQEDELLSMVAIKDSSKIVVGTQLGMLSIFARKAGWGDCVDRVPGHPHSVDALCALPSPSSVPALSSLPSPGTTILTGSSDGLVRAVQLFPTKLLGVVADHGEFPVESIKVDRAGEGAWVASAGHEEVVRMVELGEVFGEGDDEEEEGEGVDEGMGVVEARDVEEDLGEEQDGDAEGGGSEDEDSSEEEEDEDTGNDDDEDNRTLAPESTESKLPTKLPAASKVHPSKSPSPAVANANSDSDSDSGSGSGSPPPEKDKKRKRKKEKDPLAPAGRRKRGRNEMVVGEGEGGFFKDL